MSGTHPWSGAIGRVRDRFANSDDYWEIPSRRSADCAPDLAHEIAAVAL